MAALDLSLDPQEDYERKLTTAEGAAALVASGDLVWVPSGQMPPTILAALARREPELRNVTIRSTMIPDFGWFRDEAREAFDLQIQYAIIPQNRQALAERRADFHLYHMIHQHKAIDAGREEARPIDDLMLTVSPPNRSGYVCVGHSCWDSVTTARRAKPVTVEVNDQHARTRGDTWLHVSQIDAFVPTSRPPLPPMAPIEVDPVDEAIAANVKTLVRDGDTIQIGLGSHTGALPALGVFDEREDLAYFGELTVPGLVDLVRRGNINGRRAQVHPDRFVACYIGNSPEDLAYIDENPAFELYSSDYTNDPRVICRNENIVTINGALMVDLTGQIGVYSIGPHIYTGLGGHLGFALGAALAPRGRAVTVLPAAARGGTVSAIVPQFDAGQIVSVPRELADTIVTDHGVARLLGRSVRERADELIRVAAPQFRDELRAAARKLFYA
jgi:4-hydroxybutyrate CoA-transferase